MQAIHRSALPVFAAIIALFAALAAFVAKRTSAMMSAEAERTVRSVVRETVGKIDQQMVAVETATRNYAWAVGERLEDPEAMYGITRELVRNNDLIIGSAIAFEPGFYRSKGRLYAPYTCVSTNGQLRSFTLPYDYDVQNWYRTARGSGQACWCDPYFDEGGGGVQMCTFSVPIKDAKNRVVAVLTADVSLEHLTEQIAAICPYPHSYATVVSKSGKYVVMPPQGRIFERDAESVAIRDTAANGWTVAVICPTEPILAGAQRMMAAIIIFAGFGLLIIVLMSWAHSSRLQRESALCARMANELEIARRIQTEIVPTDFPACLCAALRPFRGVGGDIYDFLEKDGRIFFLVGDASGSGIPAAIFSFVARMAFRTVCGMEDDPGRILGHVNGTLCRGNCLSVFMTAFVGVFDPKGGEIRFSCAGQNPPLVVAPDGAVRFVEVARHAPLGVDEGSAYGTETMTLGAKEKFLAFTDGIVRRERADRACFGDDRLLAYLSGCGASSVSETVEGLLKSLDDFAAGAEQTDDIALVALGR